MQGLSLNIPAGTSCALVGTSGSGKSTVLRLLFRFYEPDSGTLSVAGRSITDYTMKSLRAKIGEVCSSSVFLVGHLCCLHQMSMCAGTGRTHFSTPAPLPSHRDSAEALMEQATPVLRRCLKTYMMLYFDTASSCSPASYLEQHWAELMGTLPMPAGPTGHGAVQ